MSTEGFPPWEVRGSVLVSDARKGPSSITATPMIIINEAEHLGLLRYHHEI
jgi:hypothetical protein